MLCESSRENFIFKLNSLSEELIYLVFVIIWEAFILTEMDGRG
jgi:hypothetical protein